MNIKDIISINEQNNDVDIPKQEENKQIETIMENEKKNDDDEGEEEEEDKKIPPLPVCPPPSQVVAFAIKNDADEQQKMESIIEEEKEEIVQVVSNIVVTSTATYLVDEITAKAATIVDDMHTTIEQKQQDELNDTSTQLNNEYETNVTLEITQQKEIEEKEEHNPESIVDDAKEIIIPTITLEIESNNEEVKDDEEVEISIPTAFDDVLNEYFNEDTKENVMDVDEEIIIENLSDLPPPPPSPPSEDDDEEKKDEEEEEEEKFTNIPTTELDKVINLFETKMNEIEQKVIVFETMTRKLVDDDDDDKEEKEKQEDETEKEQINVIDEEECVDVENELLNTTNKSLKETENEIKGISTPTNNNDEDESAENIEVDEVENDNNISVVTNILKNLNINDNIEYELNGNKNEDNIDNKIIHDEVREDMATLSHTNTVKVNKKKQL